MIVFIILFLIMIPRLYEQLPFQLPSLGADAEVESLEPGHNEELRDLEA
jgi:hypothetical protein